MTLTRRTPRLLALAAMLAFGFSINTLSLFGLGLFVAADALEAWICRWRHAD